MTVWMPGSDLKTLDEDECLRLLATKRVGRLAVVLDGQPAVFPVNYAVDGSTIVFRTGTGTKLDAAELGLVAFEVDDIDEHKACGWDVLIQGHADDITTAVDHRSEELRRLPVRPWAPDLKDRWVRILPTTITGRALLSY